MEQRLFITDTETAGLEGGVCDLAIVELNENLDIVYQVEHLIDPERPISPSAMGVHHITNEMVEFEPTLSEFMDMSGNPFKASENPIICGHNIAFDVRMLGEHIPPVHTRLCTLKLAKLVWPDAENHKLQTLRYLHGLEAGDAHRAMGDVITCISLLRLVAEQRSLDVDDLLALVKRPISLETKLTFGKHKGTKLGDLPATYVHWLLHKADNLDPDLREALTSR